MAKEIIRRNGTTSEHSAFTGAEAEITVDTDKNTVVVHDGVTSGGFPLAKDDGSNISDFAITGKLTAVDAEFNGTSAITVPEGTQAQRPASPLAGMIRLNSDEPVFEGYDGTEWSPLGGGGGVGDGFAKADTQQVAWTKTGNGTAETSTALTVEVDGGVVEIPSGTSISMPSLSAGTDYAIWVAPDGTLEADASFTVAPTANGRRVGGFHYAPGGNATLDSAGNWNNHTGGDTTAQINEYSFYDLKWRPSVADPRGLTLVNESFWTGMYLMSANTTVAPLHKYNVEPARDGNNPQKPYGDGTTYGNAKPMNVFECLSYYGFRAPDVNEFQLLALGVNEERSIGGSGPGNTGDVTDRSKNEQTSAWGVFDATGVLLVWGRDSLPDNNQDNGVTEGRSDNVFRISRFARFGGNWGDGSFSGSRFVSTTTSSFSGADLGGRGVCDHLILD